MTISGLKQLQNQKQLEEEQKEYQSRIERKESSDDSYPDPINYEDMGNEEEGSQEFIEFLNQYGQKDENGDYRLDNEALAMMQIAQTKKKEQQKFAKKQKHLQEFLQKPKFKRKKKNQKARKIQKQNASIMRKILKGARTLIKKEKEELNKTIDKTEKKRRTHVSAQFEKKMGKGFSGMKKKLKQPVIDDLLLQLKKKNVIEKRSVSANKYASRLGNLIKTQTITYKKKKIRKQDRSMAKNASMKLLSKSALRHTDFRSPSRPMRKKKPFIKKKRATLKKNFLSYNFKKQPKNEQFLGRKQINVLKQ